jgi:hypothetical protein
MLRRAATATVLAVTMVVASIAQEPPAVGDKAKAPAKSTAHKVAGLELTLEGDDSGAGEVVVDAKDKYITVRARPGKFAPPDGKEEDGWDLDQVSWAVVTVGKSQSKTTENIDRKNSTLIAGLPEPDESLFVYACATVSKEVAEEVEGDSEGKQVKVKVKTVRKYLTRQALLVVTVKGDGPQPARGAQPALPEAATEVPAGIRGLHVILVPGDGGKELEDLGKSREVAEGLRRSQSRLHVYDAARLAGRPDIAKLAQEAGVPCLVIVSADGKRVYPKGAVRLPVLRYDGKNDGEIARRNAVILLDVVGRSTGGRPADR